MSEIAIEFDQVTAGYGNLMILNDLSFQARRGKITLVLGPNGAGKSTTLKTLFGMVKARQGQVRLHGKDLRGATPKDLLTKHNFAFVPQGRNLFGQLTAYENLELGGFTPLGLKAARERIPEVLRHFPRVNERLYSLASSLSGGEQKQLEVARALLLRPKILLIDEPSIGLSPIVVADTFRLLKNLADQGTTVLLVEQNVKSGLKIADDVIAIESGRLAFSKPAADAMGDPNSIACSLAAPSECLRLIAIPSTIALPSMTTVLERGLDVLEHLASSPGGLPLTSIAASLDVPKSACHRILAELKRRGYVRQLHALGAYVLTTRVTSIGLSYLSSSGIVDIAQPLIEVLAESSGQLVRLAVVDDERLTWVARAEGGRKGFRYDPDMGMNPRLACTASGHAWLMTMTDEAAIALVSRQGFGEPRKYGPKAPTTVKALLGFLRAARVRGYAMIDEAFAPGMAAIGAPVRRGDHPAIGVISVAGPRKSMTTKRMQSLVPDLVATTRDLAATSGASGLFTRPLLGKA